MNAEHKYNELGIGRVTPLLHIGGVRVISDVEWLRAEKITNILKLYDGDPYWPADFNVHDIPLADGVFIEKATLKDGVDFIRERVEAEQKILVLCGLGISRSATFILAYLLEQGYDLHQAFRLLRTARPQAWPARELWSSLIAHYTTPYTLREIMLWAINKGDK